MRSCSGGTNDTEPWDWNRLRAAAMEDKDKSDEGMGTSGEIRRQEEAQRIAKQRREEELARLREAARRREEEERRRKGRG